MTPISFKANYINSVNIKKLDKSYNYQPCKASFVELDMRNKSDVFALKETLDDWGECLGSEIYEESTKEEFKNNKFSKNHVFAITTQNNDFENLNPYKVLGLVEFKEYKENYNKLELIQVHPDNVSAQFGRPDYKNVGSGMLDSIKSLFSEKPIKLFSVLEAVDFYKKNNFIKDENLKAKNAYIWEV